MVFGELVEISAIEFCKLSGIIFTPGMTGFDGRG